MLVMKRIVLLLTFVFVAAVQIGNVNGEFHVSVIPTLAYGGALFA